jgi:signal transduction histidine kinase
MTTTQSNTPLQLEAYITRLFEDVVETIVNVLDFHAAMFAVLEKVGDEERIVIKAFSAQMLRNKRFKDALVAFGELISGVKLIGAYVVVNDPQVQKNNKAVQAIVQDMPYLLTDDLHDLFTPNVNRTLCRIIQNRAGVRSMVTMPFRNRDGKLVGNLYAGSNQATISQENIDRLRGFTQMATFAIEASQLALENAHYARNAERMAMLASGVGNSTHKLNNLLGVAGSAIFMEIAQLLTKLTQVIAPLDIPHKETLMQLSQKIWEHNRDLEVVLDASTLLLIAQTIQQLPDIHKLELAKTPDALLPIFMKTTQQVYSADQLIRTIIEEARRYTELASKTDIGSTSEFMRPFVNINEIIPNVIQSVTCVDNDLVFPNLDGYLAPSDIQFDHTSSLLSAPVLCDSNHLHEILRILVKNACQAMTKNGILRLHAQQDNRKVVITITDNGQGIPAHLHDELFELKQSDKIGGMGYGLWYVALTVKKYGGKISFESVTLSETTPQRPHGTTFVITLPSSYEGL